MSESVTSGEAGKAAPRRRGRGWLFVGVVAALPFVALAAGFLWYAAQIGEESSAIDRNADAIVALTGGPERIGEALEQLAAGRGKRLLITGVNRSTHADALARLVPRYQRLFGCCIDIDHSAINTIGNAIETRRWAHERGFRSLVVVTSAYHMPHALAEISHQLPDATLVPFPVVTERQRAEPWWVSAASARMLMSEYLKYLVAIVRMQFDSPDRSTELASGRPRADI